jgi:hypothetical protein
MNWRDKAIVATKLSANFWHDVARELRPISNVCRMVADDCYVTPECFRAYVNAEIKVPNTLIAVGPYVGHAALTSLPVGEDIEPAVARFAETYSFSLSQRNSASKTVVLIHRRFGIPVLPEGVDLRGQTGIRTFPHERFEVVYMEGVLNILESILRLHGTRGTRGIPRHSAVAELLSQPDTLATTVAVFAAAESAINSPESTEMSEAFKATFNFTKSGEPPRAMAPSDKDGIQAAVTPLITASVEKALTGRGVAVPRHQIDDFVRVLTSPELHDEAG